jgi:hypothetical protein
VGKENTQILRIQNLREKDKFEAWVVNKGVDILS